MEDYLRYTKQALEELSPFQTIHVVLGNESCDQDSAVAALTYAYFLHTTNGNQTSLVLPVLNIACERYRLRTETTFFLGQRCGLSEDLLTFRDQIDLIQYQNEGKLQLSLVDHHTLARADSLLYSSVKCVIDHRPKQRQHSENVTVIIEPVGSCCTLIARQLLNHASFHLDHQVALLLYGTILADTINMLPEAGKTTPTDKTIIEQLEEVVVDIDREKLYNELTAAKFNISGLTNLEILDKDAKIVSSSSLVVVMCSVTMHIQELLNRLEMVSDLHKFCQEKEANIIVLMTLSTSDTGLPERQLAVFSDNRIYRQQVADILDSSSRPSLELEPVLGYPECIIVFKQGNVKQSRKNVLPIVQAFLNGDLTPDVMSKDFAMENESVITQEGFSSLSDISNMNVDDNLLSTSKVDDEFDPFAQQSNDNSGTEHDLDPPHLLITGIESPLTMSGQGSNQTSGPDSGYPSYPATPPNSVMETNADNYVKEYILPSFNSSEMVKRIQEKKAAIGSEHFGIESPDIEGMSGTPFTPQNSYADMNMAQFEKQHHLTSFNSSDMVQKIMNKRTELGHCAESDSHSDASSYRYYPSSCLDDAQLDTLAQGNWSPLNNAETVNKIQAKKALSESDEHANGRCELGITMATAGGQNQGFTSVPYTPQNSFTDVTGHASFMESEAFRRKLVEMENTCDADLEDLTADSADVSSDMFFDATNEMVPKSKGDNNEDYSREIERVEHTSPIMESQVLTKNKKMANREVNASDNDNNLNIEAENMAKEMQFPDSEIQNEILQGNTSAVLIEGEMDRTECTSPILVGDVMHGKSKHAQKNYDKDFENTVGEMEEAKMENSASDIIAIEVVEGTVQNQSDINVSGNIVAENIAKEISEEIIQNLNNVNSSENIVDENIAREMINETVQNPSDISDSENILVENIAKETLGAAEQIPINETTSDNVVAENIAREMSDETLQNMIDSNTSQNVVAMNIAREMSDETLQNMIDSNTSKNIVAENIAREMSDETLQNMIDSNASKNVVAENIAREMSDETLQNMIDSNTSKNVVAENIAREMSDETLQNMIDINASKNVVAENIAREMSDETLQNMIDSNTSKNVVAENIAREMSDETLQNMIDSNASKNVVAENIAREMSDETLQNMIDSNTSKNVVAENIAREMSDETLQNMIDSNASKNVVPENIAREMSDETLQNMIDSNASKNVVAENIAREMSDETLQNMIDSNTSKNVVAENIAREMSDETLQNMIDSNASKNVVPENIAREMSDETTVENPTDISASENIFADNIATEVSSSHSSENEVFAKTTEKMEEVENVVAVNIARQMAEENVVDDHSATDMSQTVKDIVAQTTLNETMSDDDVISNNVVASRLMNKMQQNEMEFTQNVVSENIASEMKLDEDVAANVVAENISKEMLHDKTDITGNLVARNIAAEMHLENIPDTTSPDNITTCETEASNIQLRQSIGALEYGSNHLTGNDRRSDMVSETQGNIVAYGVARDMVQDQLTENVNNNNNISSSGNHASVTANIINVERSDLLESRKPKVSDYNKPTGIMEDIAYSITENLIQNALESFPDLSNPLVAEGVSRKLDNRDTAVVGTTPAQTNHDDDRPRKPSESMTVETDYLPCMDPLHGNLNILSDGNVIETDADRVVAEDTSFRKISCEQSLMAQKEILAQLSERGIIVESELKSSSSEMESVVSNSSPVIEDESADDATDLKTENLAKQDESSCGSSETSVSPQPANNKTAHSTSGTDKKTFDKGVSVSSLEAKERMKGMEFNDEWQDDDIPGMPIEEISSDSDGSQDSDDSDDSEHGHSARPKTLLAQSKPKRKIKANLNILEDEEAMSVNSDDDNQESTEVKKTFNEQGSPDDLEVSAMGELEWENDTPIESPAHPLPQYTAEEESHDSKCWKAVDVAGKKYQMDLKVIEPYKKVLSHGGYYGDGLNAIILFCGCYLPDRSRKDYKYVMDNLFLYVISTLETLVAEDYMIVYFHGATPRRQMPGFSWLKRCYQMIDRRLKKNLKALLLVHPTLWLKTVILMTRPFISSKFSSKLKFVRNLTELSQLVPMEYIYLPDQIREYDDRLERRSSTSTPSSPSSPPISP